MTQAKNGLSANNPVRMRTKLCPGKEISTQREREREAFEYARNNLTKNVHSHTQFTVNKRFMTTNQRRTHTHTFFSL